MKEESARVTTRRDAPVVVVVDVGAQTVWHGNLPREESRYVDVADGVVGQFSQ